MDTLFPLAPFEQYMLEDDRADYPMVFYMRLKFRGALDRARFTAALRRATGRHPLLQSIVRVEAGAPSWTPAADPTPFLSWEPHDRPIDRSAAGPNDLKDRTGLRVWVREDVRRANVLLEFHHACCDGIAATQFVEDLLTAYANEVAATGEASSAAKPIALRALAPEQLRDRARFGLGLAGRLLRAPLAIFAAVGITEFFVHRPAAIATPENKPDQPAAEGDRSPKEPASVSHRFSRAQLDDLRRLAHRLGVTVNDLLIRDLLSTIDDWNRRHAPETKGCVRVSVPVNLRLASDAKLPAANVVSMVFMDRRPSCFRSPLRLLKSIRRDTWVIKKFRMGLAFNSVLALFARFHGGLARLLTTDRSMASAVLSNLGPQFDNAALPRHNGRIEIGATTLDDVEFMPPIRPLTRMALGAISYGDELTVTAQYDGACFTSEAAKSFLTDYAALVASTALGRRDESPVPVRIPRPAPVWRASAAQPQTAIAMSAIAK